MLPTMRDIMAHDPALSTIYSPSSASLDASSTRSKKTSSASLHPSIID
jgi:hypothetical protein